MDKFLEFVNGRKTYFVAASILVCGLMSHFNINIPEFVWAALAALGLGWLRSGVTSEVGKLADSPQGEKK